MPSPNDSELLARIDERTDNMLGQIRSMLAKMETFATIADLKSLEDDSDQYVTKAEFGPVKAIVFGGVGLILIAFMTALLYLTGFQHPTP